MSLHEMHGLHGMHGLLAGTAATILLAATFVTGARAVEPPTIPTAVAGVAAPRCTVGQLCTFAAPVTAATALFCTERAASAQIETAPPGEPRRLAVQAD